MTKGPDAFRTISEAAEEIGVPQHVLRFWETKFAFVRPMKRAGGRRFYRPADIEVLRGVRTLLHDRGLTIKGVQKLHREEGMERLAEAAGGASLSQARPGAASVGEEMAVEPRQPAPGPSPSDLSGVLQLLESAKAELDAALGLPPR
ncbi:MAG: MerR family transcriptional regulator [Caulobacteraceae bacterium]